jgi:predicted permease
MLGRTLVDTDENAGAAPVVVIGYELWQQRFGGDPSVLGREVRVGSTYATIVGVMPESFAFPISHRLWAPLRIDSSFTDETALNVFGRLAEERTLEEAQAELTTLGALADEPDLTGRQQLRHVVEPFALSFGISLDVPPQLRPLFYAINLFFVMLLVLIATNVALLMFARAATREGEILVRNALGASRGRIVRQLFAEALVLGSVAALIGVVSAQFALGVFHGVYEVESEGRLPFWFQADLSPATVLYTVVLALIAATVAGVLPGLKMTGRNVDARLRQLAAGGGGLRFGRVWTVVIIAQVAVTVAFPAAAFFVRRSVIATQTMDVGFAANQYLSARLELDPQIAFGGAQEADAFAASFYAATRELTRQLAMEPGVASVTLTDTLPRTQHSRRRVELEAAAGRRSGTQTYHWIVNASVDLNYFDALSAPVLAGRAFHSTDRNSGVVIVNESFVRRVLEGLNPLGQRIRYVDPGTDQPRWYEIVGVAKDLGMSAPGEPGLYHALPDNAYPIQVAMQLRLDPAAYGPRLRTLTASVNPGLRLYNVLPLTEVGASMWMEFNFLFKLLAGVSVIALVLSLAGIYAVTSFTVARRTREIGIRVALGADARSVLAATLGRPIVHVGIGILAGGGLTGALAYGVMRGALGVAGSAMIAGYAALMLVICLLACVVPMRRALRIQPVEALRQD